MARPDTHKAQAKSLFKRGLITEKQHERMLNRIAAMAPPPGGPTAAPADPAVGGAAQVPAAPAVPVTASVPAGGGDQNPATAQVPAGQ